MWSCRPPHLSQTIFKYQPVPSGPDSVWFWQQGTERLINQAHCNLRLEGLFNTMPSNVTCCARHWMHDITTRRMTCCYRCWLYSDLLFYYYAWVKQLPAAGWTCHSVGVLMVHTQPMRRLICCSLSPRRVWTAVFVQPTLTWFFSPLMAELVSVTWKQEAEVWFTWKLHSAWITPCSTAQE